MLFDVWAALATGVANGKPVAREEYGALWRCALLACTRVEDKRSNGGGLPRRRLPAFRRGHEQVLYRAVALDLCVSEGGVSVAVLCEARGWRGFARGGG